ncbi:MAG TPA: sugar ABC transporter permease [Candidatus Limiplasma stercoravium]|nr:sugar ABC transporter permease [Candidatus Limiplasma stercoravium]
MEGTTPKVIAPKRKKHFWSRDDAELTLLGFPTFVWYVLFCYLPMFGLIIAFKKYSIFRGQSFLSNLMMSEWVGFDNFKFFLTNNTFGMLLRNTILYNFVFIVLGIVVPVALAMMINEIYSKRKSKVYQTMMFFPHFLSWVVVSYFVYAFLNPDQGLLNSIITSMGGERIMWYSQPQYWPFILVFMNLWKGTGYNMVVYLASITGIDNSLYEAAMLDGASKWQQAKFITLPMLKTILITMFILNVGRIFYSDFGLFWQVTQGLPNSLHKVASTFDTFIYSALRGSTPIGRTAAASMFQSVCCCATVLIANWIVSRIDPDSAII